MAPDVARRIARISRGQAGAVARHQALAAGVAPSTITRLVKDGLWVAVHRCVYAIGGSRDSWQRRVFAAVLAAGDGAVLAGAAAAFEWGLLDRAPTVIDVAVPTRRRLRLHGVRVRCLTLPREDTTRRGRIPITTVARTVVDLAEILDDAAIEDVTVDAIRRWPRALHQIGRCLDRLPNARGSSRLRRFTALLDPDAVAQLMSKFESRSLALFIRWGIPPPQVNRILYDEGGGLVAKLEFSWCGGRLVVECDGLRFHTTPSQKAYDDRRQNRLVLEGRIVLRYGWSVLDEPQRLASEIGEGLRLAATLVAAGAARQRPSSAHQ